MEEPQDITINSDIEGETTPEIPKITEALYLEDNFAFGSINKRAFGIIGLNVEWFRDTNTAKKYIQDRQSAENPHPIPWAILDYDMEDSADRNGGELAEHLFNISPDTILTFVTGRDPEYDPALIELREKGIKFNCVKKTELNMDGMERLKKEAEQLQYDRKNERLKKEDI